MSYKKGKVMPIGLGLWLLVVGAAQAEYAETIASATALVNANAEVMNDASVSEGLRLEAARALIKVQGWAHRDGEGVSPAIAEKASAARSLLRLPPAEELPVTRLR